MKDTAQDIGEGSKVLKVGRPCSGKTVLQVIKALRTINKELPYERLAQSDLGDQLGVPFPHFFWARKIDLYKTTYQLFTIIALWTRYI